MTKRSIIPAYYLIVDLGEIISQFYLLYISDKFQIEVFGPVEITSDVLKAEKANTYFVSAILELQKISNRKIISRNLILLLNSPSKGINGVSFAGKKDLNSNIGILKSFNLYSQKEVFDLLLSLLESFNSDFYVIDIGLTDVFYGYVDKNHNHRSFVKGVRESLLEILGDPLSLDKIASLLPFEIDLKELGNYIANKSVYLQTIPLNLRDFTVEQSLIREIVSRDKVDFFRNEQLNKVILSGLWMKMATSVEQIVLTMIDGLELTGISYLYFDRHNLLRNCAPIIFDYEEKTKNLVLPQLISHYGTVITLLGPIVKGKNIGKVYLDQGLDEKQEITLMGGEIYTLPFTGKMKLTFVLDFMYGIFDTNSVLNKAKEERTIEIEVVGGEKGIILDVRGRPITVVGGREGKKQILSWNQAFDIYHK